MRRILGIDPGSVITGFGVIDSDGIRDFHVANGSIRVAGDNLPEKLGYILYEIGRVIDEWQPTEVGIEEVFVSKNPLSALKLGQARGAAICAAVQRGLPVSEYSPRTIKQSAVGYGGAGKEQMQEMIRMLLTLETLPSADAADGLAVAVCHAHSSVLPTGQGNALLTRRGSGRRRAKRWVSVP
ncbi:crossover junction endodeoxyribonuclease RuvC [Chromatiales bacterium (ex Bugula neritina AB1)]|nr:crossover junction endodeoxyribonuclease RuvC [Chromatiales bacterium (ex Bugula neritina AB1)]